MEFFFFNFCFGEPDLVVFDSPIVLNTWSASYALGGVSGHRGGVPTSSGRWRVALFEVACEDKGDPSTFVLKDVLYFKFLPSSAAASGAFKVLGLVSTLTPTSSLLFRRSPGKSRHRK